MTTTLSSLQSIKSFISEMQAKYDVSRINSDGVDFVDAEHQRGQLEVPHVVDSHRCAGCSSLAQEVDALKVYMNDLQRQHDELRKDLEDYAASTGALMVSMQSHLLRIADQWKGRDNGGNRDRLLNPDQN